MPSWVIVGASRGLGYQWLKTLSQDPSNTIIALARSPGAVEAKVKKDGLTHVKVLHGDLTDNASLVAAAGTVSGITGGSLDYLIVNGMWAKAETTMYKPGDYKGREAELVQELNDSMHTNVAGTLWSINAFIPLLKKSSIKKVMVLSSGHADTEIMPISDIDFAVVYAISKAAVNVLAMKCAIEHRKDGILFLAMSPGFVKTQVDEDGNSTPEMDAGIAHLTGLFQKYKPDFEGPISPEESVAMMKKVFEGLTAEQSGQFLSHFGNKQWL